MYSRCTVTHRESLSALLHYALTFRARTNGHWGYAELAGLWFNIISNDFSIITHLNLNIMNDLLVFHGWELTLDFLIFIYWHKGGIVVQWLAMIPHSSRVCRILRFLPTSQWTGDSKWPLDVNECVHCVTGVIQRVFCLAPSVPEIGFWSTMTVAKTLTKDEWMTQNLILFNLSNHWTLEHLLI